MRIKKFFKVFFISTLSLLLLLVTTAIVITSFYETEVIQFVKIQLNKQLKSEISIKEVNLSLFKKFPYATLEFTDVSAKSVAIEGKEKTPEEWAKPLLKAHKVYLQFNIFNIINKKYIIKKIAIEQGESNIIISPSGSENFHFWRNSKGGNTDDFKIQLTNVALNNMQIVYSDLSSDIKVDIMAQRLIAAGNFSEKEYELALNGDMYITTVSNGKNTFVKEKKINSDILLQVTNNKKFKFLKSTVQVADLNISLNGTIENVDSTNTALDIVLKGDDMNIQSVLSLLPKEYKKYSESYESTGNFTVEASIKGNVNKTEDPTVNALFQIQNGKVTEKESGISLTEVNLKGIFDNGDSRSLKSSSIKLETFTANLKGGNLSGNVLIRNFKNPSIELQTKANLALAELKDFIKIDTLQNLQGNAEATINFKGNFDANIGFTSEDYRKAQTSGTIILHDVNFVFKNSPHEFKNVNGNLLINNNDIAINNLQGKIIDSDFVLNGFLRNVLSYLLVEGERLSIDATLKSKNINLTQLLASNSKSDDTSFVFKLSEKVDFNLNTNIEELEFQKFVATNITGIMILQNKKLAFNPVHFTTMSGDVDAKGIIDATKERTFDVICDATLRHINITQLFYQFENFGQQTLTDQNVKGYLTSSIQFSSQWKSTLQVDESKIKAKADISIDNGELNDFEPMLNLSRYIAVEELKNIKFSTLKNQIEIKNKIITIPKMEIKSSALDVYCFGTHTFDNIVDYHFKLALNDLLAKKAKRSKKENDEFGVIEDDGLGRTSLFITMKGPLEDPTISYDKTGLKQNIKENVIEEKQNIKSILHDEFGWFKKDTTLVRKKKKENGKFEIELENESPKQNKEEKLKEKELPKVKAKEKEPDDTKKIQLLKKGKEKKKEKEETSDDFN